MHTKMLLKVRRYPTIAALVALGMSIAAPYALATSLGTNLTLSGLMTVPAGYSLDTAAAGVLNLGTTTATTVNIGGTQATIKVLGNLQIPANYSIDTAAAGTLNIGTTTANAITIGKSGVTTNNPGLSTMTNASTTLLSIGGSTGSTLSTVQAGYCSLVAVTVTATSTAYTTCTGAGTVDNTYRVFTQATSSMPSGLLLDAASTTATAGTLSLRVNNANAGANTSTGSISINFWAFK